MIIRTFMSSRLFFRRYFSILQVVQTSICIWLVDNGWGHSAEVPFTLRNQQPWVWNSAHLKIYVGFCSIAKVLLRKVFGKSKEILQSPDTSIWQMVLYQVILFNWAFLSQCKFTFCPKPRNYHHVCPQDFSINFGHAWTLFQHDSDQSNSYLLVP